MTRATTQGYTMGIFRLLRQDYRANKMTPLGLLFSPFTLSPFWLIIGYRLGHWAVHHSIPVIAYILKGLGVILYGADIHPWATIGPGVRIVHSTGLVIGHAVNIGAGVTLYNKVTLGGTNIEQNGRIMPLIGNDVQIFSGAIVIGPVVIGDHAIIETNAVVLRDIPAGMIAAGNPARVLRQVGHEDADITENLPSVR